MARDPGWFDSGAQSVWNATIAQNTVALANITANGTHSEDYVPTWAHAELRGYIRAIEVHATAATAVNVVFFRGAAGEAVTVASNRYIDHYAFAAADFFQGESATVLSAQVGQLEIPYKDEDRTKTFHVALQPPGASGMPIATSADVRVRLLWEPRLGEN